MRSPQVFCLKPLFQSNDCGNCTEENHGKNTGLKCKRFLPFQVLAVSIPGTGCVHSRYWLCPDGPHKHEPGFCLCGPQRCKGSKNSGKAKPSWPLQDKKMVGSAYHQTKSTGFHPHLETLGKAQEETIENHQFWAGDRDLWLRTGQFYRKPEFCSQHLRRTAHNCL